MKRSVLAVLVLATVVLAGCNRSAPPAAPPASAGPTAPATGAPGSATPSPGPTASAPVVPEFTVDGAGPYQLGATLAALQATPGLSEVTTGGEVCPQNTTARGTGVWRDIRLSFRPDGSLYLAINRSTAIPTPSGAWLGSTQAQLATIYAGIPTQQLAQGTSKAFLVTTQSGRGILFDLGTGGKVIAMIAGQADYLKSSYVGGTDFC